MAYGNNKERKNWLMRAMPLSVGSLTDFKKTELQALSTRVLLLMRKMAQQTFRQEPLADIISSKELDNALVILQKAEDGLNSCWCEQARMRVKPAIEESHKRYFKLLAGKLRFVDSKIPVVSSSLSVKKQEIVDLFCGPPKPKTKYFHVPFSIQDCVTQKELEDLRDTAIDGRAIDLFRQVIVDKDPYGLTPNQLVILHHIHATVQAQHRCPDFGAKDRYTLQLHLDYRMLPTVKQKGQPDRPSEALQMRSGETYILKDEANKVFRRFLNISAVTPGSPRISVPVVMPRKMAHRIRDTQRDWASLIVELTSDRNGDFGVGVRLVCGKPPVQPTVDLKAVTVTMGRDFGYANTTSLTVVRSDTPVNLSEEATGLIRAQSKEDAKAFFESHQCPMDIQIIEQVNFSGKRFLAKISEHCDRIDAYKSRIDLAYLKLEGLRIDVLRTLGWPADARILPAHKQSSSGPQVRQFFQSLGQINDLKKARRRLYRKIAACKKNWFGFLTTVEVKLAQAHGAVIVREDLTVEAIETDAPDYKGRTFNKMLNNGSKGQYQRMGTHKFDWNGIPETLVGSWFTSRVCTRHSAILDKKHRKGEIIHLHCCGRHEHADLHASETIANYHFLRPLLPDAALNKPPRAREKQSPQVSDFGSSVL